MLQEMYYNIVIFKGQGKKECFYGGIVRKTVAAIMVVGPDIVVEKMFAWIRSKRVWTENAALSEEEV